MPIPEPTSSGTLDFEGHRVWYRVTGTLQAGAELAPLVILHGGPGAAYDYTLAMTSLAAGGRAVVRYDRWPLIC